MQPTVDDNFIRSLCFQQAGNLRVLTSLHCQGLRDEFYYEAEIVVEWANKILPQLLQAAYPLGQLLEQNMGDNNSQTLDLCVTEWVFFEECIEKAIQELEKPAPKASPLDRITRAMDHVRLAQFRLLRWQERLQELGGFDGKDHSYGDIDSAEFLQELRTVINGYAVAIQGKDAMAICRNSRIVCFLGFHAQIIAPTEWDNLRIEVINLHKNALKELQPGTEYYVNTKKRLDQLENLNPQQFKIAATESPWLAKEELAGESHKRVSV